MRIDSRRCNVARKQQSLQLRGRAGRGRGSGRLTWEGVRAVAHEATGVTLPLGLKRDEQQRAVVAAGRPLRKGEDALAAAAEVFDLGGT